TAAPPRGPGMSGYWLGVDLGGTKILSGLFDDNLKLLARSKQPTSADGGPSGVFARIVQGVEAVLREANVEAGQVRGMALGIPGQSETGTTKGRFAPNLDWRGVEGKTLRPGGWGAAIGGVVNRLSPEGIGIGGGVTGALGDSFIERIWESAQRYTLPGAAAGVRCVPAALGDDSGIVGCAAYAKARTLPRAAEVA